MGGEKLKTPIPALAGIGSPPRGRGKELCGVLGNEFAGITPAWAGKRPWMPSDSSSSRDHPRMGGEKKSSRCCTSIGLGSPPRRRGKGVDRKIALLRYGITPAWAGKRQGMTSSVRHPWDHPRMGGEKTHEQQLRAAYEGSPPRGRGKNGEFVRLVEPHRITPA